MGGLSAGRQPARCRRFLSRSIAPCWLSPRRSPRQYASTSRTTFMRTLLAGCAASILVAAFWVTLTPGAAQQPPAPVPAVLQNYQPVTTERLRNPEPGNWLQVRGAYNGWRYSSLDQITPNNVKQLSLAWVFSTGAVNAHEAAPLVNNGVMFVSAPGNQVIALDAQTGIALWRYRRELAAGAIIMHPVSRGVALSGSKVFFA